MSTSFDKNLNLDSLLCKKLASSARSNSRWYPWFFAFKFFCKIHEDFKESSYKKKLVVQFDSSHVRL